MQILAADIGGTKSWLCLYKIDTSASQHPSVIYDHLYISADFDNFALLLTDFFAKVVANNKQQKQIDIEIMCLALPGVVDNGHSRLTNLNWELDEAQLQQQFALDRVYFVNDFQAAAMGVNYLHKADTITLNSAHTEKQAITVVTGAGTGLGLAWMDSTQENLQLFSTEGGHCDFAPANDQQIELLRFLQQQYAHVSYERILSGSGLVQLYRFLNPDDKRIASTDTVLMTQTIHQMATDTGAQWHHQANSAIDLFVEIYGAYIGNLALLYKPAGGIYIAGGIATHILPWMQGEKFIQNYLHKGRMRHLAEQTALYLVTNTRLGLQGALYFAIEKGKQ